MKKKLPGEFSPAAKLAMVMDLVQRQEKHACELCDHEHTVDLGLITPEEAVELLGFKKENNENS